MGKASVTSARKPERGPSSGKRKRDLSLEDAGEVPKAKSNRTEGRTNQPAEKSPGDDSCEAQREYLTAFLNDERGRSSEGMGIYADGFLDRAYTFHLMERMVEAGMMKELWADIDQMRFVLVPGKKAVPMKLGDRRRLALKLDAMAERLESDSDSSDGSDGSDGSDDSEYSET